jgi:hypothetical protein
MAKWAIAIQENPPDFLNYLGIMIPFIYSKALIRRSNEINIDCPAPTAANPNPVYKFFNEVRKAAEINFIPPKLQLKAISKGFKKHWPDLHTIAEKYLGNREHNEAVTDTTVKEFFVYLNSHNPNEGQRSVTPSKGSNARLSAATSTTESSSGKKKKPFNKRRHKHERSKKNNKASKTSSESTTTVAAITSTAPAPKDN